MRKLFVAIIMLTALAVNAQDVVSLAGMWKFTTVEGKAEAGSSPFTLRSSLKDQIKLPGSMLTNGKGDLVNVQTESKILKYHEKRNLKVLLLVISKSGGTQYKRRSYICIRQSRRTRF